VSRKLPNAGDGAVAERAVEVRTCECGTQHWEIEDFDRLSDRPRMRFLRRWKERLRKRVDLFVKENLVLSAASTTLS
jgi:hypothetical protein